MKLVFMPFLVASTSALVHAEALRSNVIALSVLTASARSVEGHLRQDTSPTLDEQPLIDGDDTVLQVDRFPWLSNAVKINNNAAVILEEPDIIEDEDDPRYHRLPSFTSISTFVDQQGPSESSSISSHPAFADQERGASASYTSARGHLRQDTSPTLDRIIKNIIKDEDVKLNNNAVLLKEEQEPRTLLSSWCAPTTPEMWHPNYSVAWSGGGCI